MMGYGDGGDLVSVSFLLIKEVVMNQKQMMNIHGNDGLSDSFDSAGGGNDNLYGRGGNDVYWLGYGTGHDTINESHQNSGDGDDGDKIKLKSGISASSVRLVREGDNLIVQLLDSNRALSDSLTVSGYYSNTKSKVERLVFADGAVWDKSDFALARIYGTVASENLNGRDDLSDIFDSDAGGNDTLYGRGGDDVYWLGYGTGHDSINESSNNSGDGDDGDEIRLKGGISASDVRLVRKGDNLEVQLFRNRTLSDSLKVYYYYSNDKSKVERLVFADGAVWDKSDFALARIYGTVASENLNGRDDLSDIFDSDAGGNDTLYGRGGDDVYWLGYGTGHDSINESSNNSGDGDDGDEIRLKGGISASDVRLVRKGDNLEVQLFRNRTLSDSLKVYYYYSNDKSKVERLVFADGAVWDKSDFALARIYGTVASENLNGRDDLSDIFDSDAGGNDTLYGRGGDDVYWLGYGTGHDSINESSNNSGDGDGGDEIRLKGGISASDVRLVRKGDNLEVQLFRNRTLSDSLKVYYYYSNDKSKVERLVFADGAVWDKSDFALARIYGTVASENLNGRDDLSDIFDSDAGGNDTLYGRGGDDVYWLGYGTGHDSINESSNNSGDGDGGDEIRLKGGISASDVRLVRKGDNLEVQLFRNRTLSDSLKVYYYYSNDKSKVERLVFADGAVWDKSDFALARIYGTAASENLNGRDDLSDIFDSDAGGNDTLYGRGGDDVYWLGYGTGHDSINESSNNSGDGDDGDEIRLKGGISASDVRLVRKGDNLEVQLFRNRTLSDSLKVYYYYSNDKAKIERVMFADGTEWDADDFESHIVRSHSYSTAISDLEKSNVFDGIGSDILLGYGGNDVYWLGQDTGHDVIQEYYLNDGDDGDEIKIKAGIAMSSVRVRRDYHHLYVEVLDAANNVSDSVRVDSHYTNASGQVERLVLSDGTVRDIAYFDLLRRHGTLGDDKIHGFTNKTDLFDSDAGGNDILRGYGGNDVYYLGTGTGYDVIQEHYFNNGDTGDEIRIKAGIVASSVRIRRDYGDLYVELLDNGAVSDSLRVDNYYTDASAKVEKVVLANDTLLWDAEDFALARIHGNSDYEAIFGTGSSDVFDNYDGGNDILQGKGGDDVYWLGQGTGHDVIEEYIDNAGDTGDEIRIKAGIAVSSVRLRRDYYHLYVELLNNGAVSDSLRVKNYYTDASAKVEKVVLADDTLLWNTEDFALAPIRDDSDYETINGSDLSNIFDSDAGGNDILRGYGGNDVYWLGKDTGHDVIQEYYFNSGDAGDKIRIKAGIAASSVRIRRDYSDLYVELLDAERNVSDSLRVENHYTDASGRVETVVLSNGTVRDIAYFDSLRRRGGIGDDTIYGFTNKSDLFDSDAGGNDILRGYGGNDVYWLGKDTGHDVIQEYYFNSGDAGDKIRIKAGIAASSVRIRRDYSDLYVELLDAERNVSDSLRVENHYTDASGRVETVVLSNGTVRDIAYFDSLRRRGGIGDDTIYGFTNKSDLFDSDAGGNDILRGYGGNDVYWLGTGTGHDVIQEYYFNDGDAGDKIKLYAGIEESDVRLVRSGYFDEHLDVQILDGDDNVSDSLRVSHYYTDASAKVEKIFFTDNGAIWWKESDFDSLRVGDEWTQIHGNSTDEYLDGTNSLDHFDSDVGGNDTLRGKRGDDVYWLGYGTGKDVIREYYSNVNDGDNEDEIRLKSGIEALDVQMRQINNGDLVFQLLSEDGTVSNSLRVENYYTDLSARVERVLFADGTEWDASDFASVRIRGGSGNDSLYGHNNVSDIFDSDAGGDDRLYGKSGDDVYWLGANTGHDVIVEHYKNVGGAGDEIRLKSGIEALDVRMRQINNGDLVFQLLSEDGTVSNSLRVENYYTDLSARVERALFVDDTEWDASDFASVRIRGGSGNDSLYGHNNVSDIFDSDAGSNDILYGRGGNDVYWLGYGTDDDVIKEYHINVGAGDDGDEIRLNTGIEESDVRVLRNNDGDLIVRLLDENGTVSDSLRVDNHYTKASAKVESIHANGKVLLANQYQGLIDEMAVFEAGNSRFSDLDALLGNFWQDEVSLSAGS